MTMTTADWHRQASEIAIDPRPIVAGDRTSIAAQSHFETINPATGKCVARYPVCSEEEVDRAVAAGKAAFDDGVWRRMPFI